MEQTREELIKQINELYVEMGRDSTKLNVANRGIAELEDILMKLRSIRYAFSLMFSSNPGIELATEILKTAFDKDEKHGKKRS